MEEKLKAPSPLDKALSKLNQQLHYYHLAQLPGNSPEVKELEGIDFPISATEA
ncbi:MAG: hypothetical protein HY381_00635 [Candidatus Chisholmbacteria bacterium]|nr:hypothetical protein [Candidatus Chisholmbacteria bacterium]